GPIAVKNGRSVVGLAYTTRTCDDRGIERPVRRRGPADRNEKEGGANSDLAATAQRLAERVRSRALVASLGAPTCPCTQEAPPGREKKAKSTKKEKQASRPTESKGKRARRGRNFVSDEEVAQGPPPRPVGGGPVVGSPVSIGIGGFRGPMRPAGGPAHPTAPAGEGGGPPVRSRAANGEEPMGSSTNTIP